MSRILTVEEELLRVQGVRLRTTLTGEGSDESIAHEHRCGNDRRGQLHRIKFVVMVLVPQKSHRDWPDIEPRPRP